MKSSWLVIALVLVFTTPAKAQCGNLNVLSSSNFVALDFPIPLTADQYLDCLQKFEDSNCAKISSFVPIMEAQAGLDLFFEQCQDWFYQASYFGTCAKWKAKEPLYRGVHFRYDRAGISGGSCSNKDTP